MANYFKIDRRLYEHPLFERDEYSRRDAWAWMIGAACYNDCDFFICGKRHTLHRGQLSFSIRFIAAKWLWDKAKVERFFSLLKTETMIETSNETGQLVISICNYNKYQDTDKLSETKNETQYETETRQQRDSSETKKKKVLKHNQVIYPLPLSNRFKEFWKIYPMQRKGSEQKAAAAYQKAITRASESDIITGAVRYAHSDEVARGFAKGTVAWLNDDGCTYASHPKAIEIKPQDGFVPIGELCE